MPREEFGGGRSQQHDPLDAIAGRAFEKMSGQLRTDATALILPRNRSGSQQRGVAVSFQPDRGDEVHLEFLTQRSQRFTTNTQEDFPHPNGR